MSCSTPALRSMAPSQGGPSPAWPKASSFQLLRFLSFCDILIFQLLRDVVALYLLQRKETTLIYEIGDPWCLWLRQRIQYLENNILQNSSIGWKSKVPANTLSAQLTAGSALSFVIVFNFLWTGPHLLLLYVCFRFCHLRHKYSLFTDCDWLAMATSLL